MPKPPPDYIPGEIVERAAMLGLTPKTFAEHLGLHQNRFYSFFGANHAQARPYILLADFGGISLEHLKDLILDRSISKWLAQQAASKGLSSGTKLAAAAGVSRKFIEKLEKDDGKLGGLNDAFEMSQALGYSLDKIRSMGHF